MNKQICIGNLTADPVSNTTQNGKSVCNFTVAVNRRRRTDDNSQPEADFFRVAAWGQLGENCAKYLTKGKKVCVTGAVQVRTFQDKDGNTRANLEIPFADEVEFLSPKGEGGQAQSSADTSGAGTQSGGFTAVESDELPF